MRTKSLPASQNAAARKFVQAVLERDFKSAPGARHPYRIGDAAKAFDIAQATLSDFLLENRGGGMKVLLGVAKFTGKSIEEIVGIAQSSATVTSAVAALVDPRTVEYLPRYPGLMAAAEYARLEGVSEDAIVAILNMVHESPKDLRPSEWLKKIERKDAVLEEQRRDPVKEQQSAARDQERVDAAATSMKPRIKKRSPSSTRG